MVLIWLLQPTSMPPSRARCLPAPASGFVAAVHRLFPLHKVSIPFAMNLSTATIAALKRVSTATLDHAAVQARAAQCLHTKRASRKPGGREHGGARVHASLHSRARGSRPLERLRESGTSAEKSGRDRPLRIRAGDGLPAGQPGRIRRQYPARTAQGPRCCRHRDRRRTARQPDDRRHGPSRVCRCGSAPLNLVCHHATDIDVPIACGGVAVYPGDIMVGDGEGVVVVPQHLADEVARDGIEQDSRGLRRSRDRARTAVAWHLRRMRKRWRDTGSGATRTLLRTTSRRISATASWSRPAVR